VPFVLPHGTVPDPLRLPADTPGADPRSLPAAPSGKS
jgi:hypothetical protein